jgi:hypothetical protein
MAERSPLIYNPSANQIQEVSLTDEVSVGILTATVFSNLKTISSPLGLANSAYNYMMAGPVSVTGIGTVIVGAGVSFVVV